jgi:PAS domain S-box-containing protein
MSSPRFASFDLLATPIAVLDAQGRLLAVNAALEDVLGQSRRSLEGQLLADHFVDAQPLRNALQGCRPTNSPHCATRPHCGASTTPTACRCM